MNGAQFPDVEILKKINNNDTNGWEYLYDQYAPIMFGAIVSVITDKYVAERTLIKVFVQLAEKHSFHTTKLKLSVYLYVYAFKFASQELKAKGITARLEDLPKYPGMLESLWDQNKVVGLKKVK